MDPFSQYQSMPHDQVNWAALAQQWMAMKEPQYGHDGNWEAAPRGKPIFPSATNIRFNGNECQPPPPPSNSYGRPPPPNFQPRAGPSNSDIRFDANSGPPPPPPPSNHYGRPTPPNFPPRADPGDWTSSRNEDWRVPPHGWNQGPPRIPQASTRTFFPPPPRPMNGAPLPPLMGLRPPPPPIEDDWGFGWTPPPPQIQQKPAPPPPLFASASTAPPVPLFPPPPQVYHQNFAAPENAPSPEVPFFSGDTHLDDNARNKLPAWIREGLEKAELEKKKQAEKEERIRLAEEEKRKRRELAGKSKFDSDSSDEDDVDGSYSTEKQNNHEAKEFEPRVTAEDLQEQAMLFIRQFMTKILTDGTDELLRVTCLEAMREAEKAKAEPKLLTKSSALAALSSLGDDDEETDSDADEKQSTNNGADNNKPGDDFIFKAPIGIPKNFIKTSEQRGASKTEQPPLKTTAKIENDVKSKSDEHKSTSNIDTESAKSRRSRSRSPGRRHRRSRSRSRERKEKRKRSRSRERRRSRSRDRKRSRERKRHR